MPMTSPPATREIELRDFDATFLGGERVSVTLRPEDTFEEGSETILVTYKKTGERVVLRKTFLLLSSLRTRTITEKVKDEPS